MQEEGVPDGGYRDTICAARQCLAIGAVADGNAFGVGDGFIGNRSAVTLSCNFHDEAFRQRNGCQWP
jgi:hypothetical protein